MTFEYFKEGVRYKLERIVYYCWQRPIGWIEWKLWKKPVVASSVETLTAIVERKASIARFGDGEFNLILGQSIGFQPYSETLSKKLFKVLKSDNPNILVGIPDIFEDLNKYSDFAHKWWKEYRNKNIRYLKKMLTGGGILIQIVPDLRLITAKIRQTLSCLFTERYGMVETYML